MRYPALDSFAAAARRAPQLWRVLAGLGVVAVIVIGLGWSLRAALNVLSPGDLYAQIALEEGIGTTPISALILLGSFGFMAVGTVAAAQLLHGRGPATLIGPSPRAALRDFGRSLRALAILYLALMLLPPWGVGDGPEPAPNLPPALWLSLLPLTLLALLVQTGAEELLFRGYLQQQLAARFRHPALWLALPAVAFGLSHYAPSAYGADSWLVVLWAAVFGAALGDLTARAGNLGPAVALHLANNLMPVALTAVEGNLSGLALYVLPPEAAAGADLRAALPVEMGLMLCAWLALRLALRR